MTFARFNYGWCRAKSAGFTLIEMITVIVILGVLSVGLSGFLQFGAQIYVDTTLRDHLMSSGRFAVERLNREVRHALPNSPRISGNCLEFYPIEVAATYIDIPVSPEAKSHDVTLVPFDDTNYSDSLQIAVYTVNSNDVYSSTDHIFSIDSHDFTTDPNSWVITRDSDDYFAADSPSKRAYFIGPLVSYCITGDSLVRQQGADSAVMAKSLDASSSFLVAAPTQTRNGLVEVELVFSALNETINFNNTIQVPNVP